MRRQDCYRAIGGERGSTLIIFMIIMVVLATAAVGALRLANINYLMTSAHKKEKQVFYSADVGLNVAVNDILTEFQNLSVYTQSADYAGADGNGYKTISNYRGYDVKYKITNPLEPYLYQTVSGNDILYNYAYTYDLQGQASSLTDKTSKTLNETIRILQIPLVQYYVFYGGSGNAADLEILPGPTMNSWGRIHSNGNIYIGANETFNLRNYDDVANLSPHGIVAASDIYLRRKDSGTTYGSNVVNVKTSSVGTTFTPTQTVTANITAANQAAQQALFNNYVMVQQQPYNAPNQTMFVRGGFYEQRSTDPQVSGVDGIKIVGQGGLGAGTQIFVGATDVTNLVNTGTVTSGAASGADLPIVREIIGNFCDHRQTSHPVDWTDIDLYRLGSWYKAYRADLGLAQLGGKGFLIYASRSPNAAFANNGANLQAVRLVKLGATSSSQLADRTTFTSDNPIYIQGDFNTVNTQGVAIVGDAINILSNAMPLTGVKACDTKPVATATTLYAAFFSGNVPTPAGGGNYSGGLENYPRFHENWSGINATIRGSFINLWSSVQATGIWGNALYNAPTRNWGWDVRFQNPDFWPPFIPSIYSVERAGFTTN